MVGDAYDQNGSNPLLNAHWLTKKKVFFAWTLNVIRTIS